MKKKFGPLKILSHPIRSLIRPPNQKNPNSNPNPNPSPSDKPQKTKGILSNQNMIYDISACESDTQRKSVAGFLDKLSKNGFEESDRSEKALIRVSIAISEYKEKSLVELRATEQS